MNQLLTRRRLIACASLLLTLPGCATGLGGYGVEEALRRLLVLSSQRALGRLVAEGGFFSDRLTRIPLPGELGTGARVGAEFLRMPYVQDQILRAINRSAEDAVDRVTPYVLESARRLTFSDAVGILRGGPTAATDFLAGSIGPHLIEILFPEIGRTLNLAGTGALGDLTRRATGIDFSALHRYVAAEASRSIFRAIGREEAAIRADPRSTGDPVLISVFGGMR